MLNNTIKFNTTLAVLDRFIKNLVVNTRKEDEITEDGIEKLHIKTPSSLVNCSTLSGGNQQKVAVGNWLNIDPEVMIFDEPSKGIDVNAKQQIFQIIWDQSRKGVSSILVSTELEELLETCHRILIMRNGKITKEVDPKQMTVEDLYAVCMGEE